MQGREQAMLWIKKNSWGGASCLTCTGFSFCLRILDHWPRANVASERFRGF
jgi:hypothetical protein